MRVVTYIPLDTYTSASSSLVENSRVRIMTKRSKKKENKRDRREGKKGQSRKINYSKSRKLNETHPLSLTQKIGGVISPLQYLRRGEYFKNKIPALRITKKIHTSRA